jgi:4-amino-4-deoxy-L-arabinose transferase-like glycosyltransferase
MRTRAEVREPPPPHREAGLTIRRWGPPVLLLLLLFGVLLRGSQALSFTSDEPAHIAVGYTVLTRGQAAFWILPQHGHPPLLNVLEATLVYLEHPAIPLETLDDWSRGYDSYVHAFAAYLAPTERAETVTRIPTMLLTMLLGALVFRWGRELWGYRAGLIALVALCFDPTLLAHGRLATTDVGTAALGTASLYLTWRWMESPSWSKALSLGSMLGLTMLAKGNGLLWEGVAALLILWALLKDRERRSRRLAQAVVAGMASLVLLWAGYAFTWGPVQGLPGSYPAPTYWNTLLSLRSCADQWWVFALGMHRQGRWWWYFPLAFLIKNPLPLLLGLSIGSARLLRSPISPSRLLALGLFPVLYTITAITGGMNIGYRHMLPVHPFIYLAVGGGMASWLSHPSGKNWRWTVISLMGLWYAAGTLRVFPYEIAYFNEMIGGPRNGHRYLVDSNIDWGQGNRALLRYLEEHPGPFSTVVATPFHPSPGRYVVPISALQLGWPGDPDRPDMYAWFRHVAPEAEIGYSFFVYDVSTPQPQWIAQCTVPAAPLSAEAISSGFGLEGLRRIDFDCTAGWVYPAGGQQPGAYALHDALLQRRRSFPSLLLPPPAPSDPFVARRLTGTRLALDTPRYTREFPAFALYEQEEAPELPPYQSATARPAEGGWGAAGVSVAAPVPLAGPLSFLGVGVFRDESGLNVETWWRVTAGPITRPFSIMAHLLSADGEVLGVADGLAVSPVEILSGDILVQRHRFHEAGNQALLLRTGAYWLDTMERWPVDGIAGADALWVHLPAGPASH